MLSSCVIFSKNRSNVSIFSNTGCARWGQTSSSMNVHKPYNHTRSHAPAPRSAAAPGAASEPPAPWEDPAGGVPGAGRSPCYRLFIRPLPRYGLMDRFEGGLFIVLFPAHTPYLVCRYALWAPASNHRWPHPPCGAPLDLLMHGLMSYGADTVPCTCARHYCNIEAVPVVR